MKSQGWVYLLFFSSGLASLIYQLLWTRMLGQAFGSTAQSASTTVAAFLFGLGLGARAAARWLPAGYSPGRCFAVLEIFIAVYSLLLTMALPRLVYLNGLLVEGLGSESMTFFVARFVVVFLLLLPACLAMGATLPVLTEHCAGEDFHGNLARLYAANTLGAAMGPLLADFYLIRHLGIFGTSLLASSIDLGVGVIGWLILTSKASRQPAITSAQLALRERVLFFATGYCSLCLEILWIRILVFFNLADVYAFSIVVSTFLGGLFLGSVLSTALARRFSLGTLLWGVSLGIVMSLACALAVHDVRLSLKIENFNQARFFTAAFLILPVTVLLGAIFPLQCDRVKDRGAVGAVGQAYLWNTLGSLLGSLSAGFVLLPTLGLQASVLWVAVLAMLAALLAEPRRWLLRLSLLALVAMSLGAPRDLLVKSLYREDYKNILFLKEDSYGAIALIRQWNPVSWDYDNNLVVDRFNMMSNNLSAKRYAATLSALPLLVHPDPEKTLVICFGLANTASVAVGSARSKQVDCVELTPTVVEATGRLDYIKATLANPKFHLIYEDGRNFLATTAKRYDIITAEPPPPIQAGVVNLYTREYFEQCRRCLKPGGMVTHWLPVQQMSEFETRTIMRACQDVFPHTVLWSGSGPNLILLASLDPLTVDFRELRSRFDADRSLLQAYGIESPWVLWAGGLRSSQELSQYLKATPPLTDDRPYLQHYQGPRQADYNFFFAGPGRFPAAQLDPTSPEMLEAREYVNVLNQLWAYSYEDATQAQVETWKRCRRLLELEPDSLFAKTIAHCTPTALAQLERRQSDPRARQALFGALYALGQRDRARALVDESWPPRLRQAALELP